MKLTVMTLALIIPTAAAAKSKWEPAPPAVYALALIAAPASAGTDADHAGEDPGQVALIGKAAGQGHIRQRPACIAQLLTLVLAHNRAASDQRVLRSF